jgi:hypothetical protein
MLIDDRYVYMPHAVYMFSMYINDYFILRATPEHNARMMDVLSRQTDP